MKIACIGAGPAGLYFALLAKQHQPALQIDVFERNPRGSTFGWGVVFSDGTLENLARSDQTSYQQIFSTLNHWDDIEIFFKGHVSRSSGHGFCGIARQRLLNILEERCQAVGVSLHYKSEVSALELKQKYDLVVAADGVFSNTRETFAQHFKPAIELRDCRYTWLGTKKLFDAFTFSFKQTEHGWFQAHAYRFSPDLSTFIVETPNRVWQQSGIEKMSKQQSIDFCQELFADLLNGEKLISNTDHLIGSAAWIRFPRVHTANWSFENVVLLGDSAATAHFSIGSGTKLAMESAICLADLVCSTQDIAAALRLYEETRRVEVLKLQSAARNSTEWFETVARRVHLPPEQFSYSLLTRSQRVSHENLRQRDATYLSNFESWWSQRESNGEIKDNRAPMFVPYKLRDLTLPNRIAVSPMAMYSASDGVPGDFHLVHLGSRALGGAGLIFTEMTCVSPQARITPGCAGIYSQEAIQSWKRIVDFIHVNSDAVVALQLGHAGPKGSTKVGWEGMDQPLDHNNWPLLAASAVRYAPQTQIPCAMTRADMDSVIDQFVRAAKNAFEANFDMLELHCAHGYLLSSFLSPLTNQRKDEYGGDVSARLRFPLEVFDAVRANWPTQRPISVRISAVDWVDGGNTIDDAIEIAKHFKQHGADMIDVSSGQVSPEQQPIYGRMWQTPFAERIRLEVQIACMAVGSIFEPDHVNSILSAGRADLCLLARPHLADPHWTLRAAAQLGYTQQEWPAQYLSAKQQFETNIARQAQTASALKI